MRMKFELLFKTYEKNPDSRWKISTCMNSTVANPKISDKHKILLEYDRNKIIENEPLYSVFLISQ